MRNRTDWKAAPMCGRVSNCFLKGSQDVLNGVLRHAEQNGLEGRLDVRAGFCFEKCETGPTVMIGGEHVHNCTAAKAIEVINSRIENGTPAQTAGALSIIHDAD